MGVGVREGGVVGGRGEWANVRECECRGLVSLLRRRSRLLNAHKHNAFRIRSACKRTLCFVLSPPFFSSSFVSSRVQLTAV